MAGKHLLSNAGQTGAFFAAHYMYMSHQANPAETFVDAMNRHDVEALTGLMNPDHVFVDSLGNRVQGAARMQLGWRSYFTMCPDYWIRINDVVSGGAITFLRGGRSRRHDRRRRMADARGLESSDPP